MALKPSHVAGQIDMFFHRLRWAPKNIAFNHSFVSYVEFPKESRAYIQFPKNPPLLGHVGDVIVRDRSARSKAKYRGRCAGGFLRGASRNHLGCGSFPVRVSGPRNTLTRQGIILTIDGVYGRLWGDGRITAKTH
ncbi:MAG: hypothetical protein KQI62_10340 [Deltaproteobacteria bacterium]|nr:hypothetical protein [Deltaproteobacteria bacterium]